MAGEATEFFSELLFGSGSWLGLILIIAIVVLVVKQVKYSSLAFTPILGFLGVLYLENVSANSNFMFSVLICWGIIPLLLFMEFKR